MQRCVYINIVGVRWCVLSYGLSDDDEDNHSTERESKMHKKASNTVGPWQLYVRDEGLRAGSDFSMKDTGIKWKDVKDDAEAMSLLQERCKTAIATNNLTASSASNDSVHRPGVFGSTTVSRIA